MARWNKRCGWCKRFLSRSEIRKKEEFCKACIKRAPAEVEKFFVRTDQVPGAYAESDAIPLIDLMPENLREAWEQRVKDIEDYTKEEE